MSHDRPSPAPAPASTTTTAPTAEHLPLMLKMAPIAAEANRVTIHGDYAFEQPKQKAVTVDGIRLLMGQTTGGRELLSEEIRRSGFHEKRSWPRPPSEEHFSSKRPATTSASSSSSLSKKSSAVPSQREKEHRGDRPSTTDSKRYHLHESTSVTPRGKAIPSGHIKKEQQRLAQWSQSGVIASPLLAAETEKANQEARRRFDEGAAATSGGAGTSSSRTSRPGTGRACGGARQQQPPTSTLGGRTASARSARGSTATSASSPPPLLGNTMQMSVPSVPTGTNSSKQSQSHQKHKNDDDETIAQMMSTFITKKTKTLSVPRLFQDSVGAASALLYPAAGSDVASSTANSRLANLPPSKVPRQFWITREHAVATQVASEGGGVTTNFDVATVPIFPSDKPVSRMELFALARTLDELMDERLGEQGFELLQSSEAALATFKERRGIPVKTIMVATPDRAANTNNNKMTTPGVPKVVKRGGDDDDDDNPIQRSKHYIDTARTLTDIVDIGMCEVVRHTAASCIERGSLLDQLRGMLVAVIGNLCDRADNDMKRMDEHRVAMREVEAERDAALDEASHWRKLFFRVNSIGGTTAGVEAPTEDSDDLTVDAVHDILDGKKKWHRHNKNDPAAPRQHRSGNNSSPSAQQQQQEQQNNSSRPRGTSLGSRRRAASTSSAASAASSAAATVSRADQLHSSSESTTATIVVRDDENTPVSASSLPASPSVSAATFAEHEICETSASAPSHHHQQQPVFGNHNRPLRVKAISRASSSNDNNTKTKKRMVSLPPGEHRGSNDRRNDNDDDDDDDDDDDQQQQHHDDDDHDEDDSNMMIDDSVAKERETVFKWINDQFAKRAATAKDLALAAQKHAAIIRRHEEASMTSALGDSSLQDDADALEAELAEQPKSMYMVLVGLLSDLHGAVTAVDALADRLQIDGMQLKHPERQVNVAVRRWRRLAQEIGRFRSENGRRIPVENLKVEFAQLPNPSVVDILFTLVEISSSLSEFAVRLKSAAGASCLDRVTVPELVPPEKPDDPCPLCTRVAPPPASWGAAGGAAGGRLRRHDSGFAVMDAERAASIAAAAEAVARRDALEKQKSDAATDEPDADLLTKMGLANFAAVADAQQKQKQQHDDSPPVVVELVINCSCCAGGTIKNPQHQQQQQQKQTSSSSLQRSRSMDIDSTFSESDHDHDHGVDEVVGGTAEGTARRSPPSSDNAASKKIPAALRRGLSRKDMHELAEQLQAEEDAAADELKNKLRGATALPGFLRQGSFNLNDKKDQQQQGDDPDAALRDRIFRKSSPPPAASQHSSPLSGRRKGSMRQSSSSTARNQRGSPTSGGINRGTSSIALRQASKDVAARRGELSAGAFSSSPHTATSSGTKNKQHLIPTSSSAAASSSFPSALQASSSSSEFGTGFIGISRAMFPIFADTRCAKLLFLAGMEINTRQEKQQQQQQQQMTKASTNGDNENNDDDDDHVWPLDELLQHIEACLTFFHEHGAGKSKDLGEFIASAAAQREKLQVALKPATMFESCFRHEGDERVVNFIEYVVGRTLSAVHLRRLLDATERMMQHSNFGSAGGSGNGRLQPDVDPDVPARISVSRAFAISEEAFDFNANALESVKEDLLRNCVPRLSSTDVQIVLDAPDFSSGAVVNALSDRFVPVYFVQSIWRDLLGESQSIFKTD